MSLFPGSPGVMLLPRVLEPSGSALCCVSLGDNVLCRWGPAALGQDRAWPLVQESTWDRRGRVHRKGWGGQGTAGLSCPLPSSPPQPASPILRASDGLGDEAFLCQEAPLSNTTAPACLLPCLLGKAGAAVVEGGQRGW